MITFFPPMMAGAIVALSQPHLSRRISHISFPTFFFLSHKNSYKLTEATKLMSHGISEGPNKHRKITTGCGQIVKLPQGALRVIYVSLMPHIQLLS